MNAAFQAGGFVFVDEAFACRAIQHAAGLLVSGLRSGFVTGQDGFEDAFHGGAHAGTLASVVSAGFFGLFDAFFRLRGIGQGMSPKKSCAYGEVPGTRCQAVWRFVAEGRE